MGSEYYRSLGQQNYGSCKFASFRGPRDGDIDRSMCFSSQSANIDFKDTGERRHGARITPQAERPIPALEGLDLSV